MTRRWKPLPYCDHNNEICTQGCSSHVYIRNTNREDVCLSILDLETLLRILSDKK